LSTVKSRVPSSKPTKVSRASALLGERSLSCPFADLDCLPRNIKGDTVNVHVKNNLMNGTAIHWHVRVLPSRFFLSALTRLPSPPQGIAQNGSVWSDGPNGVTQCPIPSGETFTYRFTLDREDQYGSYCES
jgi:hypothetical protein